MQNIVNQISKSLEIRKDLLESVNNEEALLLLLTEYIQELINKNFEHLLWLLYRVDVGEKKVKQAIENTEPENVANTIAKMILEREKEKIATREKYSTGSSGDDWIF